MQTNDKTDVNNTQIKWSSKTKNTNTKVNDQNAIEMKPQFTIDLINSSKTSPNKSSVNSSKTNDKKSSNNVNNGPNSNQNNSQTNKRSKDITDVRKMENTLLTLLEDFHSGKLQAFGQDITFEKMESVREQQERLARLHFDLNLQQEVFGHQTEEGKRLAKDNMTKLIQNLQELSNSIEQLQTGSSVTNTHS